MNSNLISNIMTFDPLIYDFDSPDNKIIGGCVANKHSVCDLLLFVLDVLDNEYFDILKNGCIPKTYILNCVKHYTYELCYHIVNTKCNIILHVILNNENSTELLLRIIRIVHYTLYKSDPVFNKYYVFAMTSFKYDLLDGMTIIEYLLSNRKDDEILILSTICDVSSSIESITEFEQYIYNAIINHLT